MPSPIKGCLYPLVAQGRQASVSYIAHQAIVRPQPTKLMESEMKTGDVVFVEESNGWGLTIRLLFREHHNVKGHAERDAAAFRVPR
jgi:hypothetical protein